MRQCAERPNATLNVHRASVTINAFMETIENIRSLPPLETDSIHIWGMHVPDLLGRMRMLENLLSASEREKAARLHREGDRQSSVVARGALRLLLARYTGIPASDIEFGYCENGKPALVPPASSRLCAEQGRQDACDTVSFNVSHSGEWVVLAFGRDRAIGVDIEQIKKEMDVSAIAARY